MDSKTLLSWVEAAALPGVFKKHCPQHITKACGHMQACAHARAQPTPPRYFLLYRKDGQNGH